MRSKCKQCGGACICEHGRERDDCKECGGSGICEHGRRRRSCKECGGSGICEHGKERTKCVKCYGGSICEHRRVRSRCKECGGGSICNHGRHRDSCVECGGSKTCKYHIESQCFTLGSPKYEGYCVNCYSQLFPDKPISRNYRTKERCVADFVRDSFPDYDITFDKKVPDGCSKKRPDIRFDFGSFVLIVEVDEHRHQGYSCENKRIMTIMQDIGLRPMVIIRFNPDAYVNENGNKVTSCWGFNKLGKSRVKPSKQIEWTDRLNTLNEQIENCISNGPTKDLTVIHLFY